MTTPKLVLASVHASAATYSFQTVGDEFKSWALCTVNDQTGELLITSSWGSWSHRWNASPGALGHPTLTAFIGGADVDYLARKLQREGNGADAFCAGYDAGWYASGEGNNAEYSPNYSDEKHRNQRDEAFARWKDRGTTK